MKKLFASIFVLVVFFVTTAFQNEKDITVTEQTPGVYVIKLNTVKLKGCIRPYFVKDLTTNKEVYDYTKARLVVNAGFFDPKNQHTTSFVTIDSNVVLDPQNNTNLVNNPVLKPYLDKIYNRSEFRVLSCGGDIKYDIAPHNAPVETTCYIKHAIQGGPGLVPDLRLEEEFFILKKNGKIVSQSASSLMKYPRTAIGIKDNNVYLIIATTKAPMSLEEVSNLAKSLGLQKAMAFDGGGSTSLDFEGLHIISDKDSTARKLKSFLMVTE